MMELLKFFSYFRAIPLWRATWRA